MYKYVDEHGVTHYTNVPDDRRCKPVEFSFSAKQPGRKTTTSQRYSFTSGGLKLMDYRDNSTASFAYDLHIQRAARAYRIDPMLIKAIIKTESNFDPYAVSPRGAQGLMQLMPGTARELQVEDPFDARQNVYGGTSYFRKLLDSYNGNIRLSLAAYNAGPGRVKTTVPQIPETVAYVSKVMRLYRAYRNEAGSTATSISVRQLVVN